MEGSHHAPAPEAAGEGKLGCIQQTAKVKLSLSENYNRPGVAGAVLQTSL